MKREIKFRAWIYDLEIMLNNITLYGNGQMGYYEDEFEKALPKDFYLDYDSSEVERRFLDEDGDEDFETIMPASLGEDWIWLDEENFIPMQYIGLKDIKGKEIHEGDIVKWGHVKGGEENPIRIAVVEINPDIQFVLIPEVAKHFSGTFGDNYVFLYGQFAYKDTENWLEVIGNIHQNQDLL